MKREEKKTTSDLTGALVVSNDSNWWQQQTLGRQQRRRLEWRERGENGEIEKWIIGGNHVCIFPIFNEK